MADRNLVSTQAMLELVKAELPEGERLKIHLDLSTPGDLAKRFGLDERKDKLPLYIIMQWYLDYTEGVTPQWRFRLVLIGDNRYFRLYDRIEVPHRQVREMTLAGAIRCDVEYDRTYYRIVDDAVQMVCTVPKPRKAQDRSAQTAHVMSKNAVLFGLNTKTEGTLDFLSGSASGFRQNRFLFQKHGFNPLLSSKIRAFELSIPDGYRKDVWEKLDNIEKVLEMATSGAYSLVRGQPKEVGKLFARFGMGQSSSLSLGNKLKVAPSVRIVCVWDEAYEADLRRAFLEQGHTEEVVEALLKKAKRFHKEDVADGSFLIRASWIVGALRKLGIHVTIEDVVMSSAQCRWAMLKGTGVIVYDLMLDSYQPIPGVFPYRGYDLIPEINSMKMPYREDIFTGDFAPEFDLLAMSSKEGSDQSDNQIMNTFAWCQDPGEWIDGVDSWISDADKHMMDMMTDPVAAMAYSGIITEDLTEEALSEPISDQARSRIAMGLAASTEVVHDPSWRQSVINQKMGYVNREIHGKMPIKGFQRLRIQTDVMAFFVTQARWGEKCLELLVCAETRKDLALPSARTIFCNGMSGEMLLARNPLNHPGEIPTVTAVADVQWGKALYAKSKGIIWVPATDPILLQQMGGADVDGDIAALIWNEAMVKMGRNVLPLIVELESVPAEKQIINQKVLRETIASSLLDSGIGLLTNWNTTARDLWHIIRYKLSINDFSDFYTNERFDTDARCNVKVSVPIGILGVIASKAESELASRGPRMPSWEKPHAEEIAALAKVLFSSEPGRFEVWAQAALKALEAISLLVRYLQEMSINTAKTGLWVFYEAQGTEKIKGHVLANMVIHKRYDYLKLPLRAQWHKPYAWETYAHAGSPMQYMAEKSKEEYKAIQAWAKTDSYEVADLRIVESQCSPEIWAKVKGLLHGVPSEGRRGYLRTMQRIQAKYSFWRNEEPREYAGPKTTVLQHNRWVEDMIRTEQLDKERREAFAAVTFHTREAIFKAMEEFPGQEALVLQAAYSLAIEANRSDDSRSACSFAWSSVGDELARLLYAIEANRENVHLRLVPMHPNRKIDDLPPEGMYSVETELVEFGNVIREVHRVKSILVDREVVWGNASVPNGEYELRILKGRPYLVVGTMNEAIPAPAPRLNPVSFRVVGLEENGIGRDRLATLRLEATESYTGHLMGKQTVMVFHEHVYDREDKKTGQVRSTHGYACFIAGKIIGHLSRDAANNLGRSLVDRAFVVTPGTVPEDGVLRSLEFRTCEEADFSKIGT